MRNSKRTPAMLSVRMISVAILTTWFAIFASWSCQNASAFAFTKIPNSLLDDRHPHQDRRHRHPREPTITSTFTSKKSGIGNTNKKNFHYLFSAVGAPQEGSESTPIFNGRLLLLIVASLYGSLNVLLRFVYDVPDIPPTAAALSATRGWMAFLCFLPPLYLNQKSAKQQLVETAAADPKKGKGEGFALFRSGFELATWGFLAQGLLNVGLVSTGSARASFLTQTSVLFTPLISTSIGKQSVSKNVWLGCVVALVGLVVLTMGAGAATAGASTFALSFSRGDLFVLGGALSWSMYLFRISSLGPKHPDLILQGVKTGLMAVIYSIWWMASAAMNAPMGGGFLSILKLPFSSIPSWMTSSSVVWITLFLSAIGPGMVADVLQQKGQKDVSPSEANILLSAEPVFATIFAVLLLGEKSSLMEMVGGALILIAAVVSSA